VKVAELIRKVQAVGRRRDLPVRFVASRGKGSHGTLYLGSAFTTVKDRNKEQRDRPRPPACDAARSGVDGQRLSL